MWDGQIYFRVYLSGGSTSITSQVYYWFFDGNSGYGANITCYTGSICVIICYGNECSNLLQVGCLDGGNVCSGGFLCDHADYSVWCRCGSNISSQ